MLELQQNLNVILPHLMLIQEPTTAPGKPWATFRPTKLKFHYVAPQFFIFQWTVQMVPNFLHWNAHIFLFGLILRDIPNSITNSITPQTTLRPLPIPVGLLVFPCTCQCRRSPLTSPSLFFLSRTEEPAKAGTCAHGKRALQQIALNVHVKHSDLTWQTKSDLNSVELCGGILSIIKYDSIYS